MRKPETPKREKLYSRRRWVLRRFAVFLIVLLAVNHFMGIGHLLPIQGIRQVEERQGAPHGAVLERDWAPEIHRTHLVYLTASEEAVTLADTYLTVYGWMGGFGWTLDCTTGKPLYAGEMYMSRDGRAGTVCYYYGRVADPAIETVEIRFVWDLYDEETGLFYEEEGLRLPVEDFRDHDGYRHFLVRHTAVDRPYDAPYHTWVTGYDRAGQVVAELEIEEGTHSYFG